MRFGICTKLETRRHRERRPAGIIVEENVQGLFRGMEAQLGGPDSRDDGGTADSGGNMLVPGSLKITGPDAESAPTVRNT